MEKTAEHDEPPMRLAEAGERQDFRLRLYAPPPLDAGQALARLVRMDAAGDPDWRLTPSARIDITEICKGLAERGR